MHRLNELIRMLDERKNSDDFAKAFKEDVAEMVKVCGYSKDEAVDLLVRQIDSHASLMALDSVADVVLAFKPKPKSKAEKKRVRKAKRDAKSDSGS